MTKDKITVSTVAIGRDSDTARLQQLATLGDGRYHFADTPSSIPEIFTEETTLATRAYIIEEPFFPSQISPSPILEGITEAPQILGYVGTTAKDTAQTILISNLADGSRDPILAAWQYGLGKAVAWTSDTTGRWGTHWVSWSGFPTFIAQAVRFTINESVQSDITADVKLNGETATLSADAYDNNGDFINNLSLLANVVAPDGSTQTVRMTQTASGRYEAAFTPTLPGAYLIRVAGPEGANTSVGETSGWVLSYSPEYKTLEADPDALARLAALADGRLISEPPDAFDHSLIARRVTRPTWPFLLTLAVLLLPFDIAVRRLTVSRYDIQRAMTRLREYADNLLRPKAEPARVESMSR
ncbi:MAG: glutamine amidotransferase, partial [Chloroflexota bacterium]